MKTNKMKAIGLALAIAAVSANATSLTYNSHGAGANVTINFPGHTNYQVYAGALNCSLTAAPAGYPTPFKAFCVDLQHSISTGQTWDVNLIPLPNPGLNESGRIGYLYTNFASAAVTNNDSASGMQLAFWDLVVDGGDGLAAGAFQVASAPAATITAANDYLSLSVGQSGPATWFESVTHERQDLVGPSTSIPEPQSLSLLGAAFLPMLGFCRRRKQ